MNYLKKKIVMNWNFEYKDFEKCMVKKLKDFVVLSIKN